MSLADDLQGADGYTVYRPLGDFALPTVIPMIARAIERCQMQQVQRLFIDITGLTGLKSPTISERYEVASAWTAAAGGVIKIAVLCPPHLLDSERFAVTVARNRGLQGNVFVTETEALAWLLDPQTD
jgi:hypothetical protein